MRYGVLIPAYQPDHRLLELVRELRSDDIETVVVNDGSTVGLEIFPELERLGAVVLHHQANRGMGGALKTGFAYMSEHGFDGVVAADADGQHTPEDIRRVAEALTQHSGELVLGARDVSQMPRRSKMGNSITRLMFNLLYGIMLQDTQTGLRGMLFTKDSIPGLLRLPSDRYDYQMEVLVESGRLFPKGIVEVPIQTIYIDNNRSSHFRVLQDSIKIYSILLCHLPRFMASSLLAFAVDYGLFNLLYYLVLRRSVPATVLARLVSCTVNYTVNKRIVFRGSGRTYNVWNYIKLAAGILIANSLLIYLLVDRMGLPAFIMKILVECLLYLVSFAVQNQLASKA